MERLGPILILVIIWLCIGLPISRAKKREAEAQAARKRAAFKQSAQQGTPEPAPAAAPAAKPAPAPVPEPRLKPTVSVTRQDDSIYQGSLNAVTGEGYDPCHDEELGGLNAAKQSDAMAPVGEEPALPFGWTGSDIVRGIVISEILNRKQPVRR